ncbi:hypothetical protein DXG01_003405 [Tephrocybe rancida]|nr:hypothetical protein DXG01_003405 [Tephrocybe rancida]
MDMPMSLASGTMLSYLHFTPGDVLWFAGWVPARGRTLFGACVGLFLLGIAERWTAALSAGVGAAQGRDVGRTRKSKAENCCETPKLRDIILMRGGTAAPFVLEHAWAQFVLHCAKATFNALFMLTAMTFQLSFILSLVIGVGVGEMMYGRFTDAARAVLEEEEVPRR